MIEGGTLLQRAEDIAHRVRRMALVLEVGSKRK
jgi:hypothetical protein